MDAAFQGLKESFLFFIVTRLYYRWQKIKHTTDVYCSQVIAFVDLNKFDMMKAKLIG